MFNKVPALIALSGIILGVMISILFGINEDIFKDKIQRDLKNSDKVAEISIPLLQKAYIKKEVAKNWRYYQRFHFHSTGISIISLGMILLLTFSLAPKKINIVSAYLCSIGGFLYPFIWLFAALDGPVIGRAAAKEKYAVFGYMGGVFLLGVMLVFFIIARYPIRKTN